MHEITAQGPGGSNWPKGKRRAGRDGKPGKHWIQRTCPLTGSAKPVINRAPQPGRGTIFRIVRDGEHTIEDGQHLRAAERVAECQRSFRIIQPELNLPLGAIPSTQMLVLRLRCEPPVPRSGAGPCKSWEAEDEIRPFVIQHRPPRADFRHGIASGVVRHATHRDCPGANGIKRVITFIVERWPCETGDPRLRARPRPSRASPKFVPPEERIATFDQDGTLWVEHPIYSQVVYCLDRVPAVVEKDPKLKNVEPFKTVLSGNREAIAKLSLHDLEKILAATLTGMSVEEFNAEAKKWLTTAKDPRWKRPYTDLIYQPMLEVMQHLRGNGFKTYIVTGGGQDFVRVYSEHVYGVPPEQVVGTAGGTKFGYHKDGKPFLTKEPKLLLNDDKAGKPEGIHLMIGRRPHAAFGNSDGDRQMLEYTGAGDGARLMMLVLHDDAKREYAYGPAQGLPASKVGTFTQALYDEAKKKSWTVISMKNDWKRIFAFDQAA